MIFIRKLKWSILLFIMLCFSFCNDIKDTKHFLGEIIEFSDNEDVVEISPQTIDLDGVYDGVIAIHDTLAFFWSPKYKNSWYSVFNLKNNQHLGYFISKGEGPDEIAGVMPINQFYEENDELKTLLYAFNNNQLISWNITKSLEQGRSVFDTIMPYSWLKEGHIAPFKDMFYCGNDSLYVYRQPVDTDAEPTLPLLELRTISTNQLIEQISTFENPIFSKESVVHLNHFFFTGNSYKPDKSKVVQTMSRLAQINIIDLKSKQVKGYRMRDTDDFSIFYGDMANSSYYYYRVQSNNDHIFALWLGKRLDSLPQYYMSGIIHVFDWDGNFIKKIKLSEPIREMWLDQTNNLLYGYNDVFEKFYCCDLNEIGL